MAGLEAPPAAEAAGPGLLLRELFRCERGGRAQPAGPAGAARPGPGHGEAGGKGSHGAGRGMSGGCWFLQDGDGAVTPLAHRSGMRPQPTRLVPAGNGLL